MARGRGFYSKLWSDADYIARYKAKTITNENGCWIWQGYIHQFGYAETSYRSETWRAHRIMFKLHNPETFDPKLDVCHSCDTPACINPAHLWQGTEKDNMIDCSKKGRIFLQRKTECKRQTSAVAPLTMTASGAVMKSMTNPSLLDADPTKIPKETKP